MDILFAKGKCLCQTDDLQALCDLQCRIAQRLRLEFNCASFPVEPFLSIKDETGATQVIYILF